MLDLPDNLMKLNASDRLAVYGYAHEYAKIKARESYLKGYAEGHAAAITETLLKKRPHTPTISDYE